jgi:histidine triad (HIT) family protein
MGNELLDCIKQTAMILIKEKKGEGFNVLSNNFPAAGQAVHHVHYHAIPRNEGDGVKVIG